ncbi:EamA family transporter RarD [Bacillus sp. B1-b2]|uniref:EamA family transporter RarD n=1 Tax=Bacillus sp. B1-b2 TaxID=2653201 RepID=UPI0012623A7A|nr:EamA family transporter RarD [Bacillus sp. B1-b2]KAB7667985.1 EamA family transporter RarD [Bacillus sp. B1-b2]
MEKNNIRNGVLYAAVAYLIWGLFPIYWKNLQGVGADEILASRVLWSFVFMAIILTFTRKWKLFYQTLLSFKKNKKQGLMLFIASILVSCNWFIYIWAVNSNKIIETSLGYYINPLVSVLLGIIVLKEKLSKIQYVSVALAGIGVFIITFSHGAFPWVAISLALTFGLYGLAKKLIKIDSEIGLTLETMFITPFALLYLGYLFIKGDHAFLNVSASLDVLLMTSGVLTAIPLLFFAKGAQRIPLSMLGFIQYLTPTLTLILGVFVYHEPFTSSHLLSFMFIWLALTIYSLSKTKLFSKSRKHKEVKSIA